MALIGMIKEATMESVKMKGFNCTSHSETIINTLMENVHGRLKQAQGPVKAVVHANNTKIKDRVEKKDD